MESINLSEVLKEVDIIDNQIKLKYKKLKKEIPFLEQILKESNNYFYIIVKNLLVN